MSCPIQPMADYVVVMQGEAASKTASGLYVPEAAKEKPMSAKVQAIGSRVSDVKVGDEIIYGGYSNTDIKVAGKTYTIVKEENIYAKLA